MLQRRVVASQSKQESWKAQKRPPKRVSAWRFLQTYYLPLKSYFSCAKAIAQAAADEKAAIERAKAAANKTAAMEAKLMRLQQARELKRDLA